MVFKFWGDNVDKQRKVRDPRSDNEGKMLHMFSILAGRSRTPAPELPHTGGTLSVLDSLPATDFLPTRSDVVSIKRNLADKQEILDEVKFCCPLNKHAPYKRGGGLCHSMGTILV